MRFVVAYYTYMTIVGDVEPVLDCVASLMGVFLGLGFFSLVWVLCHTKLKQNTNPGKRPPQKQHKPVLRPLHQLLSYKYNKEPNTS
jgi:hypothetical protein